MKTTSSILIQFRVSPEGYLRIKSLADALSLLPHHYVASCNGREAPISHLARLALAERLRCEPEELEGNK